MKTTLWKMMITLLVILPIGLVSCHDDFIVGISGQGDIVEETISLDEFDGFVSAIAADVYLTQGETQEVTIRAQRNIIDNLDLNRVDHGIWTIHYQQPVHFAKPVKIYITIPTLTKAGVAGSGEITGLTPFTNLDQLKLFITGSGSMDLDTESREMDVTVSGSGNLKMYGKTENLSVLVSGSGSFRGTDFMTNRADLTITGSGSARLAVDEFLHVRITGSGNVYYYGNPEVDLHVAGSGNVLRGL